MMPRLSRILLYPIKSLPAVEVAEATITQGGALLHDREYALVDARGQFFNGKLRPAVHRMSAAYALRGHAIQAELDLGGTPIAALLDGGGGIEPLERALSDRLGETIRIGRRRAGGFPDDTDAPGPTMIAAASLAEVASWYPGCSVQDMRRRFRVNMEFDDCPAFWEDGLFGEPGVEVVFRVGDVTFFGVNPCQRCVVPSRDPSTGEEWPGFQRTFVARRKATLPAWAPASRFAFHYRLSVNTRADENQVGKRIRVGDRVEILRHAPRGER